MSVSKAEDDNILSSVYEDGASPRKRMRPDNMSRKSWSLMDRKTDQEVLQEMGVRLLEPDDSEPCDPGASGMTHKTLKRHRDIENVNPNINLVTSPKSKCSPRSKMSPHAGPSKIKSPRSGEKHPLLPTDQQLLETTLSEDYLIDEETPLAQSVSAQYLPQNQTAFSDCSSSGRKRRYTRPISEIEEVICRRHKPEPTGTDAFNILSDEMILSVFRWLPKRTLAHCMMVCKRWHRVACDESLWQRLELGNKTLSKDALGRILARKPIIVRLASSEIGEWHPTSLPVPSRIQYLDLSMATLDILTLNNLLLRCESLKKLSLESVTIEDSTCQLIGKCINLETLNLTMAQGVTASGLNYILTGCTSIQSLNISWCNLDETSLDVLVTMLPAQLQRLNISGARIMTDEYIARLVERCPNLVELDSSDCARLTEKSAAAVLNLHSLEHLALSRCYLLPASALAQLSSSRSLQYVEAWGSLPAHAHAALRAALPRVRVNHFMFSAIARPTVGTRRTSIWGLRTRD